MTAMLTTQPTERTAPDDRELLDRPSSEAARILRVLARLGVGVGTDGAGALRLSGPTSTVPPALRSAIGRNKGELLAAVTEGAELVEHYRAELSVATLYRELEEAVALATDRYKAGRIPAEAAEEIAELVVGAGRRMAEAKCDPDEWEALGWDDGEASARAAEGDKIGAYYGEGGR